MTVQHKGNQDYTGLSTDTKPTATLTAVNAIFTETDTNNEYINTGTAWVLYDAASKTETLTNKIISNDSNTLQNLVYDAIIYKTGTTYKGKLYDGTQVFSSTSATDMVTGIQTILDAGGLIFWPAFGDQFFQPPSTFTGWHLKSETTLLMGSTRIILPGTLNQPNSAVFWIDDNDQVDGIAKRITLNGGRTQQGGGTPTNEWTWLRMRSSKATGPEGTTACRLFNHYVKGCRNFIVLETVNANDWVNGNIFRDLWCDYANIGIQFVSGHASSAFTNNFFDNVVIQANPGYTDPGSVYTMLVGIKDIISKNNMFLGCKVWDLKPGFKSCTIAPGAEDTVIMNGLMTTNPEDWEISCDFGKRTVVGFEREASAGHMNFALNNPFIRKSGAYYGVGPAAASTVGEGLFGGIAATAGPSVISSSSTTSGLGKKMSTSGTANTLAGIRSGSIACARYWSPLLKARIKLNTTTEQRIFVGYASSTGLTLNTADDPLASLTGYGLYHSTDNTTSATNWLVARNTGGASSTFTNTGIPANNTNVQDLFVAGWELTVPKFQWRIGYISTQIGEHTTTIPGQVTGLVAGCWMGNYTANDKSADVYAMFLKNNKSETV
jgi:hypothetical protein